MATVAGPGREEPDGEAVKTGHLKVAPTKDGRLQAVRTKDGHLKVATTTYFAAPEYSSICLVRSSGYDTVTSVIVPDESVTGVSFGITKPV